MTPDTEEAYEIQLYSGRRVLVRGCRVGDFAVRRLGFDVAGVTSTGGVVTAQRGTYVIDHLPSGFSVGPFECDAADPEVLGSSRLAWVVADVLAVHASGLKTADELRDKADELHLSEWVSDYLAEPVAYRQWLQQRADRRATC